MTPAHGDWKKRVPPYFQKESGQQPGFYYHTNLKARMTRFLFFDCLLRFNQKIQKTPHRNFLLLLDNCTAHDIDGTLPKLSNATVLFVLFDTSQSTSRIQPCAAGIIAFVMSMCKRKLLTRLLDNMVA